MSEPWWDPQMPFMTGHNQRPTYKWVTDAGSSSGFALQLPPGSYVQSDVPVPKPLASRRHDSRGDRRETAGDQTVS